MRHRLGTRGRRVLQPSTRHWWNLLASQPAASPMNDVSSLSKRQMGRPCKAGNRDPFSRIDQSRAVTRNRRIICTQRRSPRTHRRARAQVTRHKLATPKRHQAQLREPQLHRLQLHQVRRTWSHRGQLRQVRRAWTERSQLHQVRRAWTERPRRHQTR